MQLPVNPGAATQKTAKGAFEGAQTPESGSRAGLGDGKLGLILEQPDGLFDPHADEKVVQCAAHLAMEKPRQVTGGQVGVTSHIVEQNPLRESLQQVMNRPFDSLMEVHEKQRIVFEGPPGQQSWSSVAEGKVQ